MWKNVKVHPWVGSQYEKPEILPFKTLILGESNYTSEDNFDKELVINCIEEHINQNTDVNFSRFATKTRRVVLGRNTKVNAYTFWGNVVFYNFVQYLVGGRSKERPTEVMWNKSVLAFNELIVKLKPERILVLGKENWNNLLSHISHEVINEHMVKLNGGEIDIIAGYIVHPSYGGGFSYKKWQPVAEEIVFYK